jgi:hypothetical protein
MENYLLKNKISQKSGEKKIDTEKNRIYQIIHHFKKVSILAHFDYYNIPFFKNKTSLESVHLLYSHLIYTTY